MAWQHSSRSDCGFWSATDVSAVCGQYQSSIVRDWCWVQLHGTWTRAFADDGNFHLQLSAWPSNLPCEPHSASDTAIAGREGPSISTPVCRADGLLFGSYSSGPAQSLPESLTSPSCRGGDDASESSSIESPCPCTYSSSFSATACIVS
jgi:hypothetical protein